ncbi:MAG TPA: uroporphyrinogen-III C-methyltransferase [Planctomycetota bacterium]|nr:uroporphyrinogen-III C-methyltransferase [Planctomycetota bacterium]
MKKLFPIYLQLRDRTVVVIGAGRVAERRLRRLLDTEATIRVVAPQATPAIEEWDRKGRIALARRPFEPSDLDGAQLAFLCVGDPALNARVHEAADERGVLLNDAEVASRADFHVPAVASREEVQIAVSTGGTDPSLAAKIRDVLNEWLASPEGVRIAESRAHGSDLDASEPAAPRVSIVGAGPGDPGLLTLRALDRLERADVVYYDRLVGPAILERIPGRVELVYVGKDLGRAHRANIGELLIRSSQEGLRVVRLKGGDPGLFGRLGEELIALARAGVDFEIVPGVSSLLAGPAAAGFPITYRELSNQVVIRSGHLAGDPPRSGASQRSDTTWVYFMAVGRLAEIVASLEREGVSRDTPVAVIERGSLPEQRVVTSNLASIVDRARDAEIEAPALVVVGDVVRFSNLEALANEIETATDEDRGSFAEAGGASEAEAPSPQRMEAPWTV